MSKSSLLLLFSVEQWEFIRRLRNSGISKEQICQAFDDLDRIERELGTVYQHQTPSSPSPPTPTSSSNEVSSNLINLLQQQFTNGAADQTVFSKSIQNFQLFMAKNIAALNLHQRLMNTASTTGATNNTTTITATTTNSSAAATTTTTTNSNRNSILSPSSTNTDHNNNNVNSSGNGVYDIEDEIKELEDFRSKGDINIHHEISHFVHKYDLKQSQIARMAGVNQAYVSKFLRGDFSDLSENGKTLIYKWYLKFTKNPLMLANKINGQYNNNNNSSISSGGNNNNGINDNLSNDSSSPSSNKLIKLDSNNNNNNASIYSFMNTSYEAPKRTRFSFKPDHLTILEKSFMENPYPDPKKREELAKLCNNVRNTNDLSDRERVTEQIVTHWFQNKRKLTRRVNCDDSVNSNYNDQQLSSSPQNNDSSKTTPQPQHHQDSLDYDADDSPIDYQEVLDEVQLAAYKAVMRMNNNKSPSTGISDAFNHDLNTEIS